MKIKLDAAVEAYNAHMRSMNYAPNTIQSASYVLGPLMRFAGDRYLHNVTDLVISDFMIEVAKTRKKASSMAQTHARLSAFFNWAVKTGRLQPSQNPMNSRRRPRVDKVERRRVDVAKFPKLLALADERSPRDRMIVGMGLFTLLREQDIASRRIRDVSLDNGSIYAQVSKSRTEDHIPISRALDTELRRWFRVYQDHCGDLRPDWYLIPNEVRIQQRDDSGTITTSLFGGWLPEKHPGRLGRFVRPVLEAVGLPARDENNVATGEGAHTLRRSGARALYDALVDMGRPDALRIVQTLLHHADITQTQLYIGLNPDRESRDAIMRGAMLYGFEALDSIGGVSDHGDGEGDGAHLRYVSGA